MNFSYFTVFLKNRNISSKIERSKFTDYAALRKGFEIPIRCICVLMLNLKTNVGKLKNVDGARRCRTRISKGDFGTLKNG